MQPLPEFKKGDKVTYKPYELAIPKTVINVEYTERVPFSKDKCWIYTLDNRSTMTSSKNIVESINFEPFTDRKEHLQYIDIINGRSTKLDLNYNGSNEIYAPASVKIVENDMRSNKRLRYGVEFLEDSVFIHSSYIKTHGAYKKGDLLFVPDKQLTL